MGKGFKIAKTGSGNEREIVWNGKQLGKGDFTLTDKRFTTTQTLSNGKSLTTTITWKNRWDSRRLSLDLTGDAEFGAGPLAASSPVQTEVKLSFDVDNADLNGKFMKVYAGKEYSVVFQPGFTMPSIKVGA